MRIVIADDVDLILRGLQAVLSGWEEAQIVGAYQSVSELLAGLAKVEAEVIVLDDRIDPECGTVTMLTQVQAVAPRARLVLLGSQSDGLVVQELFARGIHGYLFKSDTLSDVLIPALRAVWAGKPYLSPTASAEHMLAVQEGRQRWKLDDEALSILRLLADGQYTSKVAARLKITVERVYWVRYKLRQRFGVETNEAMILRATAEGFLP